MSPQGLDPPKPFQKFILVQRATAPSYNMVLIIISIKLMKPSFSTADTAYIYLLVLLLPISIMLI